MANLRNFPYAMALMLLAAGACNQGEPEDIPKDYYPTVAGATWTYFHSSRGGWEETVVMEQGEESDQFVLKDTENPDGESSENTLTRDGTAILRTDKRQLVDGELAFSVTYDPGFLRFDESWLDEDTPFEDERSYVRTETDVGESPKTPRDRVHIFTVELLSETVEVEGGIFRNCIRVRRQRESDETTTATAAATTDTATQDDQGKLFWFAPGVGKVKEQNLDTGNTEVLVDYEIPAP